MYYVAIVVVCLGLDHALWGSHNGGCLVVVMHIEVKPHIIV